MGINLKHKIIPWNYHTFEDGRKHELVEEEYVVKAPRIITGFSFDLFWRFRPGSFFVIKHPRKISRINGKDEEIEYNFRGINAWLRGSFGRKFLPYAENIYNKLVKEGIVKPYSGPMYWGNSGPELTDSDGNVHILSSTEPFLRKTIKQTLQF